MSALSCTVCATIFTVPILLTSFGAVSVLSPISNLMTVGVTALCFVGGFVLCVAAAVCPALVPMLAGLVRPLISYLLWSANTIADLGFGTLHPNNTFGLAALGIVFAVLLVWLTAGKHQIKWKAVLPCLDALPVLHRPACHRRIFTSGDCQHRNGPLCCALDLPLGARKWAAWSLSRVTLLRHACEGKGRGGYRPQVILDALRRAGKP